MSQKGGRLRGGGHSIIYSTFGDRRSAARVSLALVQERLAACANSFSIDSVYRWKGEVRREPEVGVFVKTRAALVTRAIARLRELHPYENPCAVELKLARGLPAYLDWIDECTSAPRRKKGKPAGRSGR
jgi:periplasmic divalent cation tolerance protein